MREAQLAISRTAVLIKSKSSVCVDQMCFITQTSDWLSCSSAMRTIEPSNRAFHNKPHPCDMASQTRTLRNRGIHLNLTGVRDEMERL